MPSKRHLLLDLKTGRTKPALSCPPLLTSSSGPWQDVTLGHYGPSAVENLDVASPNHVIILQREGTAVREIKQGTGGFQMVPLLPGQITLIPAMSPYSVRTADTGRFVAVTLQPQFVLCAAHELLDGDRLELIPQPACDDLLLQAGVLALKAEVKTGFLGGRLYAESVATMLAVHLVRHFSVRKPGVHRNGGGLTPFQLRRAIDFMQAHLAEDISLEMLAASAGLSPFHFARLFKKSLGLAPHQYLIRCRLERARELLLTDHASIADVAVEVGFCDQSHLAAHFKRLYGVTPRAFVRRTEPSRNVA
jgi:AraC family transcriptional regulator